MLFRAVDLARFRAVRACREMAVRDAALRGSRCKARLVARTRRADGFRRRPPWPAR